VRKEVTLVVLATLALIMLGVVMVYSTGMFVENTEPGEIFKKHWQALLFSAFFFMAAALFDYHHYEDSVVIWTIVAVSLALLIFVLVLGSTSGGGQRWIRYGGFGLQPSEVARVALIVMLAVYMTRNYGRHREFLRGLVVPLIIAGFFAGLVVLQKDLGMPLMMAGIAVLMLYIGGARVHYLWVLSPVAVYGLYKLIASEGYRAGRMMAFLDPFQDRENYGWQLIQSLSAFAQGGLWGRGPGGGEQKLGYVPAAHTDFIFAMVGEELGLIGTASVVLLYVVLLVAAVRIAMNAPDYLGSMLAAGVGVNIAMQTIFIMCVTTGLLPTKGLPLPFMAYGGTALLMFLISVGILVNVGAQSVSPGMKRQLVPAPKPAPAN